MYVPWFLGGGGGPPKFSRGFSKLCSPNQVIGRRTHSFPALLLVFMEVLLSSGEIGIALLFLAGRNGSIFHSTVLLGQMAKFQLPHCGCEFPSEAQFNPAIVEQVGKRLVCLAWGKTCEALPRKQTNWRFDPKAKVLPRLRSNQLKLKPEMLLLLPLLQFQNEFVDEALVCVLYTVDYVPHSPNGKHCFFRGRNHHQRKEVKEAEERKTRAI